MTVTGRSSIHFVQTGLAFNPPVQESPWHALYTRHQHEKTVAEALFRKGHAVFLPLYGTTRLWRNRPKQLLLPLFPGYVFIQGGMARPMDILSTPGIISLVNWSGAPAAIPPEQIMAVRRMVENPYRVEPHEYLRCGDRVRVISGALQGMEGILLRIKGKSRLVVSMGLLGQSASVEMEESCVESKIQTALPHQLRPRLENCA
jgi:transcription antitermination factor NusG